MSRTKKKKYTKSKAFDTQCRSHGGCPYCLGNRMYSTIKRKESGEIFFSPITEESYDGSTYKWFDIDEFVMTNTKEMDILIDGVAYKVDYEPEEEMKNVVIIKKDY